MYTVPSLRYNSSAIHRLGGSTIITRSSHFLKKFSQRPDHDNNSLTVCPAELLHFISDKSHVRVRLYSEFCSAYGFKTIMLSIRKKLTRWIFLQTKVININIFPFNLYFIRMQVQPNPYPRFPWTWCSQISDARTYLYSSYYHTSIDDGRYPYTNVPFAFTPFFEAVSCCLYSSNFSFHA